ncbi:MAG: hypothetical protein AAFQ59_18270 [Pseudomonadota bacterium]
MNTIRPGHGSLHIGAHAARHVFPFAAVIWCHDHTFPLLEE